MHHVNEFVTVDIVGVIVAGIASAFSVTVGLGGGSLYIPILLLIMRYDMHDASGISQCMMSGAAIATFILNTRARHPNANRPMLNLDLVLIMSPFQLSGTVIGVIINRLLPSYVIVFLMAVVMILSNITAFVKAMKLFGEEKLSKRKTTVDAKELQETAKSKGDSVAAMPLKVEVSTEDDAHKEVVTDTEDVTHKEDAAKSLNPFRKLVLHRTKSFFVEVEKRYSPWKWVMVVILWIINFLFAFFRGSGEGTIDLIDACSLEYWLMVYFNFAVMVAYSGSYTSYAIAVAEQKTSVNVDVVKGDVHLNFYNACFVAGGAFLAGSYGGLAGVGGGVILTPTLLFLHVLPQVVVSVNAALILLASSATAVLYLASGYVFYDTAALMIVLCFICTFIGKYYLDKWVKKHNSPSTILFIYVGVLLVSIVASLGHAIWEIVTGLGSTGGVANLCN